MVVSAIFRSRLANCSFAAALSGSSAGLAARTLLGAAGERCGAAEGLRDMAKTLNQPTKTGIYTMYIRILHMVGKTQALRVYITERTNKTGDIGQRESDQRTHNI